MENKTPEQLVSETEPQPQESLSPTSQPASVPILTEEEIKAIKGRPPTAVAAQVKAVNAANKLKTGKHRKKDIIKETTKLDLFLDEYLKTGNATESAMRVFNCKSRTVASSLGSYYLGKARAFGRLVMEEQGLSLKKLITQAAKRMDDPKSADFVPLFDRLMKIGDYADFITKQAVNKNTVTNVTIQQDLFDEYVEGEVVLEEEEEEDE